MPTRTVNAHYWVDYREVSQSFDSIPAALAFLQERAPCDGVMANKVALDCGTVVLFREDIERLTRTKKRSGAALRLRWEAVERETDRSWLALQGAAVLNIARPFIR